MTSSKTPGATVVLAASGRLESMPSIDISPDFETYQAVWSHRMAVPCAKVFPFLPMTSLISFGGIPWTSIPIYSY